MKLTHIFIFIVVLLVTSAAFSGVSHLTQMNLQKEVEEKTEKLQEAEEQAEILRDDLKEQTGSEIKNTVMRTCKIKDCVLYGGIEGSNPVGFGTLEGFYRQVENTAWGETKKCNVLVLTGGSEKLRQGYSDLIDYGNTVNSKDSTGNTQVNISIAHLSQRDQRIILNATAKNPAKIFVHAPEQVGRGAPVCFSFFEILEVL